MYSGEELLEMLVHAHALTVNDYEARIVEQKTGKSIAAIANIVSAVIVTKGAEGSTVHTAQRAIDVPAVKPAGVVDPTGCGDAYRAGLLHGWRAAGRGSAPRAWPR
jgi:adenosine kinase